MTVKDGLVQYNFGIRKPVLNCAKLIKKFPWDRLIGKWVYSYENIEEKDIFFKYIFRGNRIYQVIYSGIDILGDGVYILYKADITYKDENDFIVIPTTFDLSFGSFECEDYLKTLLEGKYITKKEYEIFNNPDKLKEFKQGLHQLQDY